MEKTYKLLKILIFILAFAVFFAGAWLLYDRLGAQMTPQTLAPETTAPEGETAPALQAAPDFTAYDLDGSPVKLSDYLGKPVILNFWASWCGPCKMEMPEIQSFYDTYGSEIQFLIVDMTDGYQETVESGSAYIEKLGYTFPVFYDTGLEAAMAYGVTSIPATYFIDAQGNLAAGYRGAMSADILQQGVDILLPQ